MVAPRRPRGSDRVREAVDRVRRHVRARGLVGGLAGALASALLWRLRIHLLASYRHPGGLASVPDGADHVERVTRPDELSAADRDALREYGGDVLFARVEKRFAQGDWVAVARQDGELACCCWVHETSTYPPGAQGAAAFLQSAFTLPRFRGAGLFSRALHFVVRVLEQERPGLPVYIEAAVDNLSSRRAIEKAGFVRAGLRVTSPWFQRWFPTRTRPARDAAALPFDPFRNGS
jgi:GNAT superfamily N-acetyltransferase